MAIKHLAVAAHGNWAYKGNTMFHSWINGNGKVTASGSGNHLTTDAHFVSEKGYDSHAPTSSNIASCAATINLDHIHFEGGISGTIANWFKGSIMGVIEDQVKTLACDELQGLGTNLLSDVLVNVSRAIEPYAGPIVHPDPLSDEKRMLAKIQSMSAADEMAAMDKLVLLDNTLMTWARTQMNNAVASWVNTTMPDGSVREELNGNVLIRQVTDEGTLAVPVSTVHHGVVYKGEDPLTSTVVTLTNVTISNLDSFTKFNPFDPITNFTLQHEIAMEKLEANFDFTIAIGPSQADSSIIHTGNGKIEEHIRITTGIDKLKLTAATLLAIDREKFTGIQVGSLLNQTAACLLSSVHAANVTQLKLEIQSVESPSLTGFISPGLDSLFSNAFELYLGFWGQAMRVFFRSLIDESVVLTLRFLGWAWSVFADLIRS